MAWWNRKAESRSVGISDDASAFLFGGLGTRSGVTVGESGALSLSAVWRSVSLVAQTTASSPLFAARDGAHGMQRVVSWLDTPGGRFGPTRFSWVETMFVHLLLHGNFFAIPSYNAAGAVTAMQVVHPHRVTVELATTDEEARAWPSGVRYRVTSDTGSDLTFFRGDVATNGILHVPALSTDDGRVGRSVLTVARESFGTSIAGDRAASSAFSGGATLAGLVTPSDEDITVAEAETIRDDVQRKMSGSDKAGQWMVVNKRLTFSPWTQTLADAQFIESRQFQVEEIARWFGIPPFALMQTEKQTSWGTGIESQQRGLSRTVLAPWADRALSYLSRWLPASLEAHFDFSGLERATPVEETRLLVERVRGGVMTPNEARVQMKLPPVDGGDELVSSNGGVSGVPTPPAPEGGGQ